MWSVGSLLLSRFELAGQMFFLPRAVYLPARSFVRGGGGGRAMDAALSFPSLCVCLLAFLR